MNHILQQCIRFCKNWALPITMALGVAGYFIVSALPVSLEGRAFLSKTVGIVQPLLIFCMLFLSFCKIDPKTVRPAKWTVFHALIQSAGFVLPALVIIQTDLTDNAVIWLECAMACLICPTATAAAVITDRLGGNLKTVVAYTMIINIVAATVISAFTPLINPASGLNFAHAFGMIAAKVFPLLVAPFLLAWFVRLYLPKLLQVILSVRDIAFHLWIIALALAMAVTTRALVHSHVGLACLVGIAVVTLVCCIFQFVVGRAVGQRYNDTISAGQALGQKNTVFVIWMAYTFLHPVTAVAGGFYSIWHNVFNSWQLYRQRK